MATLTRPESRKLYSWWWDGHTAPKNSKWLLENLKDMDMLVKAMIKLLEEDADSFAKRAEMYYKRRPELLKLLEEFYRAYRAIAERYDHATGALRQAHRTLAEAFPHQMPFVLSDDPDESDAFLGKKGLKQLKGILESGEEVTRAKFAEGRVRKGLNFQDDQENSPECETLKEEISQLSNERHNLTSQMTYESERADKSEAEVQSLKGTIYKSYTEKEAADIQHQLSLEKISILEAEISRLKEDLKKLNDEMLMAAAKAKASEERYFLLEKANESIQMELVSLNQKAQEQQEEVSKKQEELEKLNLLLHEQHQAFIQTEATRLSLEKLLSQSQEQESLLALEIQAGIEKLKDIELRRVAIEEELQKIKEDNIRLNDQHHTSALNIINLQDEVQSCKGIISILNSEKKTAALQYQLSLERISALETEISSSKGDLKKLKDEMLMAAQNLNSIQEQALLLEKANELLQMELDGLKQKAHEQQEELRKKQEELDKLNVLLQEKHQGFVQSETARLSLEKLLSQSKEHERILELEILAGTEKLQETNLRRVAIEEELQKIKKENGSLNEQCLSSASKINILQDEISFFKISSAKFENEVSLLTDEKKSLQEELSFLKEDRNDLEQSYRRLTEQVEAANFNVRSLQALSKQLQSGNAELMERCNKHEKEKIVHLENIKDMGMVSERNVILENSLSDANVEIESLREKIKGLEQSCELLCDEISLHLTDKDTLASHVKAISQDMDKLSEKNVLLENSLSDVNAELEDLREKLRVSEDSCQSLGAQKSDLLAENSILVSQVEETSQILESLEDRFEELEDRHFNLETEKDFSLQEVMELQDMLKREKEEYETLILSIMLSSNSQQNTLENQIYLMEDEHRLREEEFEIQQVQSMASDIEIVALQNSLREMVEKNLSLSLESQNQIYLMQEEHQLREEEFEMQQVQSMASDIEIVVLQRSLREMEENNFSLSLESQKLLEASKFADKLLSELQMELLIQKKIFTASEERNEKLGNGIQLILKELFISQDCESFDGIEYEVALQSILHEIDSLRKSLSGAQDENQHLLLEKSVDVTILEQFGLSMMNMEMDNCTLEQESKTKRMELLFLQSNNLELQEMNKQLRQDMQSGNQKQGVLKSDMDILYGQLIYLRGAHSASRGEICKLFEENQILSKKLHALSEERDTLEEENSTIFSEAMILEKLYLIYKSVVAEKVLKLQLASDDLTRLHGVVNDLNEEIMPLTENIIAVEVENVCLKGMVANLYKCSPLMILNTTGGICDRNTDLSQLDIGGPLAVTGELQQKEAHVQKEHEFSCHCQANEVLTRELQRLHTEVEDLRSRDENLTFKLQKEENEVKCCELEIAALLENIQITTIDAVLFEQKVSELLVKCESLEISFMVERERLHEELNIRNANVIELNEKFGITEGENRGMKEALNSYLLLVEDLSDDISSLEEGIFSLAERCLSNHQGKQGSALVFHHHRKSSQESGDYHSATGPAGILELQKLVDKVKALRKVVIGTGNLLKQETFESVSSRSSESASKEVGLLKAKGHLDQEEKINKGIMRLEKRREPGVDLELQKGDAGTSTLKHEQTMKDIELDLVISSSQNRNDVISCGESMIDIAGSSDTSLDSWEPTERVPINVAHDIEYHPIDAVEEKRKYPYSERMIEKELSIDKLELPKKFTELHEEWNGRITETLSSDAQRLSVLQTSAQELKRNMEASDMCNYPTTFEFDTIRAQLKEAEVSILQLIDINSKLTKKAEDQSSSSTGQEPNEMQNKHRRQISELAARSSEKIGMLELELQKIHYIFLKLGEEHDDKKPSAINRRRILLKDYLYGKMDSRRRKKGHCGCIRPKTRGD